MVTVISLGGSIVAPDAPDPAFVSAFADEIRTWLAEDQERKVIFVVGGGGPARSWQSAAKTCVPALANEELDWIGIMATRLNAQFLRSVFVDLCPTPVVTDPTAVAEFPGRVMVGAGWKPGFSTDYDAVLLAEKFGATTVVNLSNIAKVYTADPKVDPSAKPIDSIAWKEFRAIVGDDWTPGKNLPFDPVATRHAERLGLTVVCAAGRDIENLKALLRGKPFTGTVIHK